MTIEVELIPKDVNFAYRTDPTIGALVTNKSKSEKYRNVEVHYYWYLNDSLWGHYKDTIKKLYYYSREFSYCFSPDFIRTDSGHIDVKVEVRVNGSVVAEDSETYRIKREKNELTVCLDNLDGWTWWGWQRLRIRVRNDYWKTLSGKAYVKIIPWLLTEPIKEYDFTFELDPHKEFRDETTMRYFFELAQKYVIVYYAKDYDQDRLDSWGIGFSYCTPNSSDKGEVWIEAPDYAQEGSEVTAKIHAKNTHDRYSGSYLVEYSITDEQGNKIQEDSYSVILAPNQESVESISFTMPKNKAKINAWLYAYYWKDWYDFPE